MSLLGEVTYRCSMTEERSRINSRFSDDLIGLDPADPEAQAFAEHLDNMERCRGGFTVEASLQAVADFADSSRQLRGSRRALVSLVVTLMLLGILAATWDTVSALGKWFAG